MYSTLKSPHDQNQQHHKTQTMRHGECVTHTCSGTKFVSDGPPLARHAARMPTAVRRGAPRKRGLCRENVQWGSSEAQSTCPNTGSVRPCHTETLHGSVNKGTNGEGPRPQAGRERTLAQVQGPCLVAPACAPASWGHRIGHFCPQKLCITHKLPRMEAGLSLRIKNL